jgi:hypothetical protein
VGSDRHISDILIASLADVCLEKSLPLQRGFEDAAQLRWRIAREVDAGQGGAVSQPLINVLFLP